MARMDYQMGWLMVMFDLPVTEKIQMRAAVQFRKLLLDQGFQMLQESVYVRHGVTLDKVEALRARIRGRVPEWGSVICLFITEKQWAKSEYMVGAVDFRYHKRAVAGDAVAEQMLLF
ncbi:MAG: CRISPR-associated endonuclease Cas2 [Candidatus Melainabacteria bacterium]|nr:CRISPR-associated endonuclease Cas2 [Candidatus Melainabacteria bacterium]